MSSRAIIFLLATAITFVLLSQNFAQNIGTGHTKKVKDILSPKVGNFTGDKKGIKGAISESFESWPPAGWTLNPSSGDGTWVQDDGSTYGPGATNIYDGFYAAMFANYNYTEGTTGSIITPEFDVSTYCNPKVSFYWWNNDGSNFPAQLAIATSTDGITYTDIDTIDTYGSGSTTWVQYIHDINPDDKYVKITGISDWGTKNTFIDKFEIYEGTVNPTFSINPSSKDYGTVNFYESSTQTFTITNVGCGTLTISPAPTLTGTNTIDFSITDNNTYPKDLARNESMTLDVTFSPQEEGSLSASLYVQDNTKAGHSIALTGTGYDPTLTPPFTEDFTQYLPTDWTEGIGTLAAPSTITGTASLWTPENYRNDSGSSNGQAARLEIQQNNIKDWLFSPPIDLGDGTTHYQLELDLALTDWNGSGTPTNPPEADDKFAIIISTDNGSTWTSDNALQIWDNTTNPKLSDIPSAGQHIIFDLTSYTGIVKLGFYGETTVTGSDFDIFVDNVYVREKPTTPVFSVSPGSKDFGFQAINTTSSAQTFTVTNTGGGTLQITGCSLSGTDTNEFVLTDNNTYPVDLAANESMSVDVAFSPTTNVDKSASLDFVDNQKSTHSVSLSGRGKNINHDGDGTIFGGYYYANSTSYGGTYRPTYSWIDPVAEGHTEITSWTYTNVGNTEGDDSYFDATIPFSFTFFGNNYTHAYINSNGAIEFTEPSTVYTGSDLSIPSSDPPNNFIAGCMMDLDDRTLGSVYYGTDADGNFVVTWRHYHDWGDDTEYITFQVILKQNGNIKIQYNYNQSALESGSAATTINGDALIGIENSDGSDGLQYRNNGVDGPIFDPAKAGSLALEISQDETATPVELSSFTANLTDRNVTLNWRTETEVDAYSFQVERASVDETNDIEFEMIAEILAAGNSNVPHEYSFTDKEINSGNYQYRLKMIDADGSFEYSDIVEVEVALPMKFSLSQNYPNPFSKGAGGNASTKIEYSLPETAEVKIVLYNIMGEIVAELVNEKQDAGFYTLTVNMTQFQNELASGIYLYRMIATSKSTGNAFIKVKKMLLLK